jgi:hypothetical protein
LDIRHYFNTKSHCYISYKLKIVDYLQIKQGFHVLYICTLAGE